MSRRELVNLPWEPPGGESLSRWHAVPFPRYYKEMTSWHRLMGHQREKCLKIFEDEGKKWREWNWEPTSNEEMAWHSEETVWKSLNDVQRQYPQYPKESKGVCRTSHGVSVILPNFLWRIFDSDVVFVILGPWLKTQTKKHVSVKLHVARCQDSTVSRFKSPTIALQIDLEGTSENLELHWSSLVCYFSQQIPNSA